MQGQKLINMGYFQDSDFKRIYNRLSKRKQRKQFFGNVKETALAIFQNQYPMKWRELTTPKQEPIPFEDIAKPQQTEQQQKVGLIYGKVTPKMRQSYLVKTRDGNFIEIPIPKRKRKQDGWENLV